MKCQICNGAMEGKLGIKIPSLTKSLKICHGCMEDISQGDYDTLIKKLTKMKNKQEKEK